MTEYTVIKIKRGLEDNLPSLNDGELAYTRDEKNLYIGTPDGNENILFPENNYRIEFATIELSTTMRFDFEYEDGYSEVKSIAAGLISEEARNGDIKLVAKAMKEGDKYTHVIVYASVGEEVRTTDVMVSIQAICYKGLHEKG